ncbi:protein tramtrack, beta isoform-like isoform X1 [Limulus polyphemus]|uniref:Protein tramtrack, beta isoform-like isoform X1 n=1 Tax=Limulus polyphemus TaxID=6850 RepID=A0ABM1SMV3_LIMPO|nr:protein tramtrack, beta isoform-like isoform X1 [Limulus polyphemus]
MPGLPWFRLMRTVTGIGIEMGTQQFCLKWKGHQSNLLSVFEQLLTNEALVDVTLACEGHSLKAHKLVLSASSPFFQSLFVNNPCQHPIVIMKDMKYAELKAVVDFIYHGEVNISENQLSPLLKTAEALKVKGLADVSVNGEQPSSASEISAVEEQQVKDSVQFSKPHQEAQKQVSTPVNRRKKVRPQRRPATNAVDSESHLPLKVKNLIPSSSSTFVYPNIIQQLQSSPEATSVEETHSALNDGNFDIEPPEYAEQLKSSDLESQAHTVVSTPSLSSSSSSKFHPQSSSEHHTQSSGPFLKQSVTNTGESSEAFNTEEYSKVISEECTDVKPVHLQSRPDCSTASSSVDEDSIGSQSVMPFIDTSGVHAVAGTSYQAESGTKEYSDENQELEKSSKFPNLRDPETNSPEVLKKKFVKKESTPSVNIQKTEQHGRDVLYNYYFSTEGFLKKGKGGRQPLLSPSQENTIIRFLWWVVSGNPDPSRWTSKEPVAKCLSV